MSSGGVPQDVKVNTRAVLLSSIKGVGLKRFNADYRTLVGKANEAEAGQIGDGQDWVGEQIVEDTPRRMHCLSQQCVCMW